MLWCGHAYARTAPRSVIYGIQLLLTSTLSIACKCVVFCLFACMHTVCPSFIAATSTTRVTCCYYCVAHHCMLQWLVLHCCSATLRCSAAPKPQSQLHPAVKTTSHCCISVLAVLRVSTLLHRTCSSSECVLCISVNALNSSVCMCSCTSLCLRILYVHRISTTAFTSKL
jgi:hypothetical protein